MSTEVIDETAASAEEPSAEVEELVVEELLVEEISIDGMCGVY
jgi:mycofactocin precursor